MSKAPKKEEEASIGFEVPETLAKFDAINSTIDNVKRDINDVRRNVKLVQNTNWVIIIVLVVAFLAMIFTAIYTFVQTIKSDTGSRDQLIRSVEELRTELEVIKNNESDPSPKESSPSQSATENQ